MPTIGKRPVAISASIGQAMRLFCCGGVLGHVLPASACVFVLLILVFCCPLALRRIIYLTIPGLIGSYSLLLSSVMHASSVYTIIHHYTLPHILLYIPFPV